MYDIVYLHYRLKDLSFKVANVIYAFRYIHHSLIVADHCYKLEQAYHISLSLLFYHLLNVFIMDQELIPT